MNIFEEAYEKNTKLDWEEALFVDFLIISYLIEQVNLNHKKKEKLKVRKEKILEKKNLLCGNKLWICCQRQWEK